jgi:hypothetical protein
VNEWEIHEQKGQWTENSWTKLNEQKSMTEKFMNKKVNDQKIHEQKGQWIENTW